MRFMSYELTKWFLIFVIAALSMGCVALSPEQRAELNEYQTLVRDADMRLAGYKQSIENIGLAVAEGRITWAIGKAEIDKIRATQDQDLALKNEISAKITKLRGDGVPIGSIILYSITGFLGGGGLLGQLARNWMKRKIGVAVERAETAEVQRDTIIRGVEIGSANLLGELKNSTLEDTNTVTGISETLAHTVKDAISVESINMGIEHELHAVVREVS